MLTDVPENLKLGPCSDLSASFWPPGGHFGFCRRCGVAGGERVPPLLLGWYFIEIFLFKGQM